MTRPADRDRRSRISGAVLWAPGLLVAFSAAIATAHGLYEVAAGAGVPTLIAWLYPVITDGLALVAYASTARLVEGRGYAWGVVVLAAGLSGLAQASKASGWVGDGSPALRFGVGAWPAIAAAIVAHLLFMLSAQTRADRSAGRPAGGPGTPGPPGDPSAAVVQDRAVVQPAAVQRPGQPVVQPASTPAPAARSTDARPVQPAAPVALPARPVSDRRPAGGGASPARDRARAAARRHAARHGLLPTVTELMAAAEVARGTAGAALKELREHPSSLQVVHDDPMRAEQ